MPATASNIYVPITMFCAYSLFFFTTILSCGGTTIKTCQNRATGPKEHNCPCPAPFEDLSCKIFRNSSLEFGFTFDESINNDFFVECGYGTFVTEMFSFPLKCRCFYEQPGYSLSVKTEGFVDGRYGSYFMKANDKICKCWGDWVFKQCRGSCDHYQNLSGEKCICNQEQLGGMTCHLPICSNQEAHLIWNNSTSSGFFKIESHIWFGEHCGESKCAKNGVPYFDALHLGSETTETVRCRCKKGWTGEFCKTKYCYGHGSPDRSNVFCYCNGHFSMVTDCRTCSTGWTGKNCNQPINSMTEKNVAQSSTRQSKLLLMLLLVPVPLFLIVVTWAIVIKLKDRKSAIRQLQQRSFQQILALQGSSQCAQAQPIPEQIDPPDYQASFEDPRLATPISVQWPQALAISEPEETDPPAYELVMEEPPSYAEAVQLSPDNIQYNLTS